MPASPSSRSAPTERRSPLRWICNSFIDLPLRDKLATVEALGVIGMLVFVLLQTNILVRQTKLLGDQTEQLKTSIEVQIRGTDLHENAQRMNTVLALRDHYTRINSMLWDDTSFAEKMFSPDGSDIEPSDTKEILMAYMFMADFDTLYYLHQNEIIDGERFSDFIPVMKKTFDIPWVKKVWEDQGHAGYYSAFANFVDNELLGVKPSE